MTGQILQMDRPSPLGRKQLPSENQLITIRRLPWFRMVSPDNGR